MRYGVSDARVAWRIVDGEGVLLHAESSAYFGLNRVGTLLWEQLAATPMTAEELTDWVSRAVSHNGAQMRDEIHAFLSELRAMDLLDEQPSNGRSAMAPVPAGLAGMSYEAPLLTPFGELEKLILSGE